MSLMLYVNLVTAPGVENFFAAAKDAGVDAVLIPDVPISMREAEPEWDAAAKAHGIHLIAIAPPNGTPDLYKEVAQRSTGYVYLLSRAGITGTDKTAGRPGEAEIAALRAAGSAPLLLGFGVSRLNMSVLRLKQVQRRHCRICRCSGDHGEPQQCPCDARAPHRIC